MSSSPLTPTFSAPATTTSKRLSLNIAAGPRPLHLIDSNVSLASRGPATAPLVHATFTPSSQKTTLSDANTFVRPSPRRQSSISYRSESPYVYEPSRSSNKNVRRSMALSISVPDSPTTPPRDRRSVGSEPSTQRERLPLTLAERHSELLRNIAQKEARCLELRTQLATHEAELLQLKRKWEAIVNRGFLNGGDVHSPGSQNSGAVLEGIREGVQGVSRFIASGLAIGELSLAPAPPASSSRLPAHSPSPIKHASSPSISSNSTSTTKTTRLSQSSASSLSEPTSLLEMAEEDGCQILMVHDTGATPTMSPNPAFEHQCQQRKMFSESQASSKRSSLVLEKGLRRRSRDIHSFESGVSSPLSNGVKSAPASKSSDVDESKTVKAKRTSINLTEFPPPSSIPGLASLTMGVASSPQVSSWMGSVGKKWEEIQRGSPFSKSQKRASILLADVSHSIVSALSPPSTASSPNPLSSTLTPSTTSTSLLDDDDDFVLQSASPVLVPESTINRKADQEAPSVVPPTAPVLLGTKFEEEEWNW